MISLKNPAIPSPLQIVRVNSRVLFVMRTLSFPPKYLEDFQNPGIKSRVIEQMFGIDALEFLQGLVKTSRVCFPQSSFNELPDSITDKSDDLCIRAWRHSNGLESPIHGLRKIGPCVGQGAVQIEDQQFQRDHVRLLHQV